MTQNGHAEAPPAPSGPGHGCVLTAAGLQALLDALSADGFRVMGPTLRDGAIVYDRIDRLTDLPAGWTDRQEPGRYRVERRGDNALFGYTVGPHAWKQFLHPPTETIWKARRDEHGAMTLAPPPDEPPRYAFLGVRACELHAIAIQDRVFCGGPYPDTGYQARRERAFLIAVNCGQAAQTCFCVSMQTGPKADTGYDLALTELEPGAVFLAEAGTEAGARLLAALPQRPATDADRAAAAAVSARAEAQMGRTLDTDGLKDLLQSNPNHPRWEDVAQRCLSCANCTMVCPTCFCITVEDHTDLTGAEAERVRRWDSCFTMNFSYLHGGAVRPSARARYRQWMTHKLASWHDQFGTSGCVGCGRCIAWCPVGIDITEEAAAIRATPAAKGGSRGRD